MTAATFKMPSNDVLTRASEPAIAARIAPNMFVMFGAFPIVSKGQVIGAIGYSGGDDEACARAGLRAIEGKLK